jgi:hypothetical protein
MTFPPGTFCIYEYIYIYGNTYTKTPEIDPMDGGDDYTKGIFLSAYCCIPLQSPMATVNRKALVPGKVIMWLSLPTFSVTIGGGFWEVRWRGKRNSLLEKWRGLVSVDSHRTSIFYERRTCF